MPESDTASLAAAETSPAEILTPQDATAELIAKKLNPEQARAFRAARKEKKAKAAEAAKAAPVAAAEVTTETPAKAEVSTDTPDGDTITFDPETPIGTDEAASEEEPAGLSEEEMAALDEKARKRITDASKEAAKVRKRAQEAEAKAKELEAKLAEIEQESGEALTRAAGLAGNAFVNFKDGHGVAAWAENAKEALALLSYHDREVKAGRRDVEDPVTHTLPTGQEIELRPADVAVYQQRIHDAQAWFAHDAETVKVRETAAKLADKHSATKGYKEARESYLKDKALPTRIEELVAKAALYDVLQNRRAVITFPDTAGTAKKVSSSTVEDSNATARKDPPSESRASTPRLAHADDPGSDFKARRSELLQSAKRAKTDAERQKILKQISMLRGQRAAV